MSAPTLARRVVGVASSNRSRLVLEVEVREGELTISGTETTTDGGYSGGQMVDSVEASAARIAAEPGGRRLLGEADLSALVGIWRRWHLNGMQAGCEHQRATWDLKAEVALDSFSIDWDDRRAIEREMEANRRALGLDFEKGTENDPRRPFGSPQARGPLTPTAQREFLKYSHAAALLFTLESAGVRPFGWVAVKNPRALAALEAAFEVIDERQLKEYRETCARAEAGVPVRWNAQRLGGSWGRAPKAPVLRRTERKRLCWVRPEEHPGGLLGKPCEVCGYKYGTAWLKEELPAEVLAEVERITGGRPPAPGPDDALAALGFALKFERRDVRPGKPGTWAAGARHWWCTLTREGRAFSFWYSQGPALTEDPTLADVFDCLRSEAHLATDEEEARACGVKLSEWRVLTEQAEKFRAVVGDAAEACGVPS